MSTSGVGFGKVTCADLDAKQYEGRWSKEETNAKQKYGKFVKFAKILY